MVSNGATAKTHRKAWGFRTRCQRRLQIQQIPGAGDGLQTLEESLERLGDDMFWEGIHGQTMEKTMKKPSKTMEKPSKTMKKPWKTHEKHIDSSSKTIGKPQKKTWKTHEKTKAVPDVWWFEEECLENVSVWGSLPFCNSCSASACLPSLSWRRLGADQMGGHFGYLKLPAPK